MSDLKETTTNTCGGEKTFRMSSSEQKWINKINKLHDKYPDEVKIINVDPDGTIMADIPITYFKVSHPKVMSEATKQKASERFKQMWADKNNTDDEDDNE